MNRAKVGNILFYIALTFELILMIVEKSEVTIGIESHLFRITFLIALSAVIISEHSKKEWLTIAAIWLFTIVCYKLSGKNDLLRIATFMLAAKNTDLKKAMKYAFCLCLTGFGIIALLSVLGIAGDISLTTDFGRSVGEETRFVFGFGHPNTLFSSSYLLLLLWIWLYGKSSKIYQFVLAFVMMGIVSVITVSRTGMIIIFFTFIVAVTIKLLPILEDKKWPYIVMTIISPISCVTASVLSAWLVIKAYAETLSPRFGEIYWAFEKITNYRISNLYFAGDDHDGVITSWKLFSDHNSEEFFDMGWVRIFYWYGIVPGIIIVALILLFCYLCLKQKDLWTMIIILSLGIYTFVEATFISRYIGRNPFLLVFAVYVWNYFKQNSISSIRDIT
ncbi:MAG: hypothetical protein IJJ65_09700 [Butyrivibrio sp.]|nr:hypothetical protein [Butyrivibrio sp.]